MAIEWLSNFKFDFAFDWLNIFSSTMKWLSLLVIVGGVILFAFYLLKYKYEVLIFEKRGGGIIRIKRDKAMKKVNKVNGVVSFKLLKSKLLFGPPEETSQIFVLGKKEFLCLELVDNVLFPMKVEDVDKHLGFKNVPQDVASLCFMQMKRTVTDYSPRNKWIQYAPVIMSGASFVLVFIMFLITLNQIKNGISVQITGQLPIVATLPTMTNPNPQGSILQTP